MKAWPLEHQRGLIPVAHSEELYHQARQAVRWHNRRIASAARLPEKHRLQAIMA